MNHADRSAPADPRARVAAANNAAWCAVMCRAHGLTTHQDGTRWWSSSRTPLYYPDAVTLDPSTDATGLLAGIDASAGCSVKDSFATLDLTSSGFAVLFGATWIHRPAAEAVALPRGWRVAVLCEAAELLGWSKLWGKDGTDLFVPALLEDADVRFVSIAEGDRTVGVAVLNWSVGAVGISNLACAPEEAVPVWHAVVAIAAKEFPGAELVGYEQEQELAAAEAAGFSRIGSLQVWAC